MGIRRFKPTTSTLRYKAVSDFGSQREAGKNLLQSPSGGKQPSTSRSAPGRPRLIAARRDGIAGAIKHKYDQSLADRLILFTRAGYITPRRA
jgi:hypothetical protein